jgi:soluble lytic murein transglycosylase-like protein
MRSAKIKKLKRLRIKQLSPRDYGMMVAGAILILLGAIMFDSVKQHPVALTPQSSTITSPWIPETVKRWQPLIQEMSRKYDIDPDLIAIIMTLESGGNPKAESGVGAQGLMQVMPLTAKDIADKHLKTPVANYDIFDPRTNIEFGTAYLAYLRDEFGEGNQGPSWNATVELVAAGYNGGPGAAADLLHGEGLESAETLSYSRDAFNMWRERHAPQSPTYTRWSERGGSSLVERAKTP